MSRWLAVLALAGCTNAADVEPEPCPCADLTLPAAPVTDEAGLAALLDEVETHLFPEMAGVAIGVAPVPDLQFFRAWIELGTISEPDGRDRTYTVQYDPVVLADPPPAAALAAVLGHELGHVDHYLGMTSEEAVTFGLWYGAQDPATSTGLSDYERATDEKVLVRGCADGLSAMREWIYAHTEGAVLEEKRRNYYTPEEIAAWVDEHGDCAD